MPQGNLIQIAKVLKSNGTDGELVMSFLYMDPEEVKTEEPVFIEFDGLPVPFFIQSIVRRGSTKALVRLNDVRSLKDTEELTGKAVYAEETGDGEYEEGDFSFLAGWTVVSGGRELGVIADFLDIPANPCVELEDGHIIPVHEDMIESVDEDARILAMKLPDGLID